MESVFILIPISIILAFLIGGFFWWSSKNGQFDDLEGPAHRILLDDDAPVDDDDQHKPPKPNASTASDITHTPPSTS